MVQDSLQEQRPSNDDSFVQTIQLSLALEEVARESQLSTLELLLVDGMNINAPDIDGQTPLHWAAQNGRLEAAELMLKHGADPNVMDRFGKTPLQWATEQGYADIADLLRRYCGRRS